MIKKKTKTWTFKTKREAVDFFVLAMSAESRNTKNGKIVEMIQPNKVRITILEEVKK
jgi:hypothetical protein